MTQMHAPGPGVRPHRGGMILAFGILSWFLCFIFGICAWVMGNADLEAMRRGEMDRTGEGLTSAGRILGMIHIILSIVSIGIVLLVFIVLAMIGAAAGAAGAGGP